jgi:hypothetical protein
MFGYIVLFSLLNPMTGLVSEKSDTRHSLLATPLVQNIQQVRIEISPRHVEQKASNKPYRLGTEGSVRVILKNDTDQRIKAIVVDPYYQNRPRLYKDGKLLSYRNAVTRLVASKDNDPEFVRTGSVVFIERYSSTDIEDLKLSDWYGPLEPGSYRLTNRYRLDIDAPWTAESAELRFEVLPNE